MAIAESVQWERTRQQGGKVVSKWRLINMDDCLWTRSGWLAGSSRPVHHAILSHHDSLPQGLLSSYQKEDKRQIRIGGSTLPFATMPNIVYIPTLIICQPTSPGHLIISLESTGIIFLCIAKYTSEGLFLEIRLYSFNQVAFPHNSKLACVPYSSKPAWSLINAATSNSLLITLIFDTCWALTMCWALSPLICPCANSFHSPEGRHSRSEGRWIDLTERLIYWIIHHQLGL